MTINNQRGAILPILVVILLIVGILVGTKLVSVPQIFKPKAYGEPIYPPKSEVCQTICEKIPDIQPCGGVEGKICPKGMTCITPDKYPDTLGICTPLPPDIPPVTTTASCDKDNMVTLKWQLIKEATNYTLRINKYPEEWSPDYSEHDADRATIGTGDRSLEAGNVASKVVNVGAGFFVGGTVTASDGSVQILPPFSCPGKVADPCTKESPRWACSSSNEVNCKFFPLPCDIPPNWKPIPTPPPSSRPIPTSTPQPYSTP